MKLTCIHSIAAEVLPPWAQEGGDEKQCTAPSLSEVDLPSFLWKARRVNKEIK